VIETAKQRMKDSAKVFIMSYELSTKLVSEIERKKISFVICDEAHYLKSAESKRSYVLVPLLKSIFYIERPNTLF
jgi:SNF2 family DNA or RNA helicase